VRCRVGQHANAAGGEDRFTGLVLHRDHGVGQLAAQRRHVGLAIELRRVEDDEMGHAWVRSGRERQSRDDTAV
jgi:hypothetical protein